MRFQLLRYLPDPVKGEFINIGVVLLDDAGRCLSARMAGDDDLRRVRCLHPAADLDLIRAWQNRVQAVVSEGDGRAAGDWLESLGEVASQSLQWTVTRGFDRPASDAGHAVQQIYDSFVASPPRRAGALRTGTGPWVKQEADRMFEAAGLRARFEHGVIAERFTYPGDPFRIHYSYTNGAPHYLHMLSLQHSVQQSKVLAFTFERMTQAPSGPPPRMTVWSSRSRPPIRAWNSRGGCSKTTPSGSCRSTASRAWCVVSVWTSGCSTFWAAFKGQHQDTKAQSSQRRRKANALFVAFVSSWLGVVFEKRGALKRLL